MHSAVHVDGLMLDPRQGLYKSLQLLNSEEVHAALGHQGTMWKFIPKKAPWFGGLISGRD